MFNRDSEFVFPFCSDLSFGEFYGEDYYSVITNVVWLVLSGYELTGLARGGEQLAKLKRNYAKAVELLVELASLQVRGRMAGELQLDFWVQETQILNQSLCT